MGSDLCVVYYGVRYQITDESEPREKIKRAGFSLVPALQIQFEADY
jgi:hypothetical protein